MDIRLNASCIPITVDFPISPAYRYGEKMDGELIYVFVTELGIGEGRKGVLMSRNGVRIGYLFTTLPYGVYICELVVQDVTLIYVNQPLFAWSFPFYRDWFVYTDQVVAGTLGFSGGGFLLNDPDSLIDLRVKQWREICLIRDGCVVPVSDQDLPYKCRTLTGDHFFDISAYSFIKADQDHVDPKFFEFDETKYSEGLVFLNGDKVPGSYNFTFSKLECYFWKRPIRCSFEDYVNGRDIGGLVLGNLGQYSDKFHIYGGVGVYEVSVFGHLLKKRPEKEVGDSLWYKNKMITMASSRGVRILKKSREYATRMKYKAGVLSFLPYEVDVTGDVQYNGSNVKLEADGNKKFKFYLDDLPQKKVYPGMVVRIHNKRYYVTKFKPKFSSEETGDQKIVLVLREMEHVLHLIPKSIA